MNRRIRNASAATLFTLGTLLASLPAAAKDIGGLGDPVALFAQADTNHDGVVSRAEYLAARAARFDRLDRNHDGYLTEDDFPRLAKAPAAMAETLRAWLRKADTNHDGKVSREEFAKAGTPLFDLADRNHDGVIDAAELQLLIARLDELRQH